MCFSVSYKINLFYFLFEFFKHFFTYINRFERNEKKNQIMKKNLLQSKMKQQSPAKIVVQYNRNKSGDLPWDLLNIKTSENFSSFWHEHAHILFFRFYFSFCSMWTKQSYACASLKSLNKTKNLFNILGNMSYITLKMGRYLNRQAK